jgi:diketogulonate reductase-like aldo/keto reductase
MFYGTAWKEADTQRLTLQAINAGFRAFDTANQRKHYCEQAVGDAIQVAFDGGLVQRGEIYLQTKFTFQRGQDHRLPYDPNASIGIQVEQSFESSLSHLGVPCIDSFLLHGPCYSRGLTDEDWQAWRAIEKLHECGKVASIGVSNFAIDQLQSLCRDAKYKPAYVQNRCFAVHGWDRIVRDECRHQGIRYQGFSLLTANRQWLADKKVAAMARKYAATIPQLVFRFAQDLEIIPLTGTTNTEHMRQDLDAQFSLTDEDRSRLESIAERNSNTEV